MFPEADNVRRELIVTASPIPRHQRSVLELGARLLGRAEHLDRLDDRKMNGPPDLVVEVSSPSTRRLETT